MVKPGQIKTLPFWNPFRTASLEVGEHFGRFSIMFEGMGGAFTDQQLLSLFEEISEYLTAKNLIKVEGIPK